MKTKLSIELTPDLMSRLSALTEAIGTESDAETVREAMRVLEFLVERRLGGSSFLENREGVLSFLPIFTTREDVSDAT